ncbi:TRAP transporter large permease [Sporosarcina ureae]|uniref:TRAP transporter large permease n=1 Tax=Sporosarcina ureae TaxID=1571 RepID=UPI0009DC52DE|nr:TRAP transporter large permease [Sporosarcina ureae]ARF17128.1 C4-dicarboxylate ABC transporter [Sporosarcina ureae]
MNPLILLLIVFFGLIFIRVPIAFALGISSMVTIVYIDLPFTSVINHMFASINSFTLLAVPFFLLLGSLMNDGGITNRLINFSRTLVGHIKGGLGHINILVSMIMAGLSGSAAADTAAVGSTLIPAMVKEKYDAGFTVAITAASSTLGVIIPPSIMMVVYGAMAQVSIGKLFLAGIVPGILIGLVQMSYTYYMAVKHNYPAYPRAPIKEVRTSFKQAFATLLLPVIILGGIVGGIFTPTEAAVIAVFYALTLMFFYKSLKVKELPRILKESVIMYSLPMFAIATAGIMGWLIGYLHAPELVADFITNITTSSSGIYLMIVAFLLVVGTFLSPLEAIIIFLPILMKLGEIADLDPVHMGIIVCLTLAVGMVTPPYGICLLIATQIAEISTPRAFLAVLPIIGLTLGVILLGVFMPNLFLFLPNLLMPD